MTTNYQMLLDYIQDNRNAEIVCKLIYPDIDKPTVDSFKKNAVLYNNFLAANFKDKTTNFTKDEGIFLSLLSDKYKYIQRVNGRLIISSDKQDAFTVNDFTDLKFASIPFDSRKIEFKPYINDAILGNSDASKSVLKDLEDWVSNFDRYNEAKHKKEKPEPKDEYDFDLHELQDLIEDYLDNCDE